MSFIKIALIPEAMMSLNIKRYQTFAYYGYAMKNNTIVTKHLHYNNTMNVIFIGGLNFSNFVKILFHRNFNILLTDFA